MQENADLVTFTEEISKGKICFCAVIFIQRWKDFVENHDDVHSTTTTTRNSETEWLWELILFE